MTRCLRPCCTDPDTGEPFATFEDPAEYRVVHVVEDGVPGLTTTSRLRLCEAVAFYGAITSLRVGQGGAMLCRVLHDAESQFPPERLLEDGPR